MMDTEADIESESYGNKFETDSDNNLQVEVAGNKLLLPSPYNNFKTDHDNNLEVEVAGNKSFLLDSCSAEHNIPKDTASMIEFNMIRLAHQPNQHLLLLTKGF